MSISDLLAKQSPDKKEEKVKPKEDEKVKPKEEEKPKEST
jgi:hypothetical protein